MRFAFVSLLWLLPLAPLAGLGVWWLWRRRLAASARWAARVLWARLELVPRPRRLAAAAGLLALAVAANVTALARPRWGHAETEVERRGVDIVFILDTSLSMSSTDVSPSRLHAARGLVRRMAATLPGHRFALVQAEGEPLVMAPLTVDGGVLDLLMDTAEAGSLPTPGTRLTPALEQALKLFPPQAEKHRVIVLLSDGEDHGQGVGGIAERLREEGIAVHVLGVGTPEGDTLLDPGSGEYKLDAEGNPVVTRLQESLLRELAQTTGGVYQSIPGAGIDPAPVVERIQAMETRTVDEQRLLALEERFQWPLLLAVVALGLYLCGSPFAAAKEAGQ